MERNLYEAMFVVDSAKGGSQFTDVIRHVVGLLKRHDAEIERIEKWDERKLAYPIEGVEKGIYVMVYFRADAGRIESFRNEAQMSEELLRLLILKDPAISEVSGQLYDEEGREIAAEEVETPAGEEESEEEAPAASEEAGEQEAEEEEEDEEEEAPEEAEDEETEQEAAPEEA